MLVLVKIGPCLVAHYWFSMLPVQKIEAHNALNKERGEALPPFDFIVMCYPMFHSKSLFTCLATD